MKLINNQKHFEDAMTTSTTLETKKGFIPSAKKVKRSKYLTAHIDLNYWSYVKTKSGHAMRVTLEGYGSCTPEHILQRFIDELSVKEQKEWADWVKKEGIIEIDNITK
jgi:hypothetical protein